MPTAWAAMPMRPPSSAAMAILKPSPSAPRRFAAETRHPSNTNSAVSEARSPSLSSTLGTRNPGVPFSMRNAEIPRCAFAASVWTKTRATVDSRPLVTNTLRPSST